MTAWRYEISLLVLKNVSLVHCAQRFLISVWPCILYFIITYTRTYGGLFLTAINFLGLFH